MDGAPWLGVSDLAAEPGITRRAIRFYEQKGLIAPRRVGGVRVFPCRDRARLLLILRDRRLGFSLQEIAQYLVLYDTDATQREQVLMLLAKAAARIARLEAQRANWGWRWRNCVPSKARPARPWPYQH